MMTFVAIISLTAEKMTSAKRIILGMLFKVLNRYISVKVSSVIEFLFFKENFQKARFLSKSPYTKRKIKHNE